MRELAGIAEDLQQRHGSSGADSRKFAVEVLQTAKVVFYVTARDAEEAADKWLRDEYDGMGGPSPALSEELVRVEEVEA